MMFTLSVGIIVSYLLYGPFLREARRARRRLDEITR